LKIQAPLFTKAAIAAQEGEKSTGNRMFWIVLMGSIRKVVLAWIFIISLVPH
jgi:hypothetical protein